MGVTTWIKIGRDQQDSMRAIISSGPRLGLYPTGMMSSIHIFLQRYKRVFMSYNSLQRHDLKGEKIDIREI